jgi:hypothetical protein
VRFRKNLLLWSTVFSVVVPGWAKPRSGLQSTDFLGKPIGARFVGLGLAGVALPGSPESPTYNPAALGDLAGPAFSADFQVANQSKLPQDVILNASSLGGKKLTYLGFAGPNRAIFYRPLADFDDVVSTDAYNYTQNSVRVNQFGISASQETEKGYDVGLGLSYLSARRGFAEAKTGEPPVLELAEGNGFAVDWGFRDQKGPVAYGLSLLNLPGLIYWDKYRTDQLPTLVRGGLAFEPSPAFSFFTDYEKRFFVDDKTDPDLWHFGMEVAPLPWLALRGGAESEDFNNQDKTAYTWGFSVASKARHTLDLAARALRLDEERVTQYYVTLTWPLPGKVSEERSRR